MTCRKCQGFMVEEWRPDFSPETYISRCINCGLIEDALITQNRLLQEQGADDVLVFAGGIIPEQDIGSLKQAGIDEIFLPGTSTKDIVQYLQDRLQAA